MPVGPDATGVRGSSDDNLSFNTLSLCDAIEGLVYLTSRLAFESDDITLLLVCGDAVLYQYVVDISVNMCDANNVVLVHRVD